MSDHPEVPVVLVTGASRRIGREIALTLARTGHDIAVHVHRADADCTSLCAEVSDLGRRCHEFVVDLSDESATADLVPAVLDSFGRLDHVVHNASLFVYDDVQSLSYQNLAAHACTNAGSAVVIARAHHQHLQSQARRGSMVLLLDQRLWNPNPDYLSYSLSKSALEMLTRILAKTLAPVLRVVGVAPGLTLGSPLIGEDQIDALGSRSLTGHRVQVTEVADAVAFALRNGSVTGSTLMIDAGYHLQPMARDFPFL